MVVNKSSKEDKRMQSYDDLDLINEYIEFDSDGINHINDVSMVSNSIQKPEELIESNEKDKLCTVPNGKSLESEIKSQEITKNSSADICVGLVLADNDEIQAFPIDSSSKNSLDDSSKTLEIDKLFVIEPVTDSKVERNNKEDNPESVNELLLESSQHVSSPLDLFNLNEYNPFSSSSEELKRCSLGLVKVENVKIDSDENVYKGIGKRNSDTYEQDFHENLEDEILEEYERDLTESKHSEIDSNSRIRITRSKIKIFKCESSEKSNDQAKGDLGQNINEGQLLLAPKINSDQEIESYIVEELNKGTVSNDFSNQKALETISESKNLINQFSKSLESNMFSDEAEVTPKCARKFFNLNICSTSTKKPSRNRRSPMVYDNSKLCNFSLNEFKNKKPNIKLDTKIHEIEDLSIIVPSNTTNENQFETKEPLQVETSHMLDLNSNFLDVIKNVETAEEKCDIHKTYLSSNAEYSMLIENAKEYSDIKSKNLYGQIIYKQSKEEETVNYIQLKDSFLICYNSEKEPYLNSEAFKDSFRCFDDTSLCYHEKFKIDLRDAKLYVSVPHKYQSKLLIWVFCCSKVIQENLVDIIRNNVYKVVEREDKYHLYLDKAENSSYLELSNLEFIIYSNGSYHTFKARNMILFLKWINAFQVRSSVEYKHE